MTRARSGFTAGEGLVPTPGRERRSHKSAAGSPRGVSMSRINCLALEAGVLSDAGGEIGEELLARRFLSSRATAGVLIKPEVVRGSLLHTTLSHDATASVFCGGFGSMRRSCQSKATAGRLAPEDATGFAFSWAGVDVFFGASNWKARSLFLVDSDIGRRGPCIGAGALGLDFDLCH